MKTSEWTRIGRTALAVAVATLAVAGCAKKADAPAAPEPGAATSAPVPPAGDGAKKLNIYIWSAYRPQEVLDEFSKRTSIPVNFDLYDSNEALLEKLQSGVADYDIVVPSDYMVRIMISEKL